MYKAHANMYAYAFNFSSSPVVPVFVQFNKSVVYIDFRFEYLNQNVFLKRATKNPKPHKSFGNIKKIEVFMIYKYVLAAR